MQTYAIFLLKTQIKQTKNPEEKNLWKIEIFQKWKQLLLT